MVSSPILIHLINRMRFKRIRWAAMEFLLKSQKRNRRRLIIEQLILLLLRCLLVLLAAFLVARFVGSALGLTPTTNTTHVVLLDDTLSMTDRAPKDKGPGPDCFAFAKTQIAVLARHASEANSAQYLRVVTLSDRQEIFSDRLNDVSLQRLNNILNDLQPTFLHADTTKGVEHAKKVLGAATESKRWLHVVSDFRDADWGRHGSNERLHELLQQLCADGANVTLIDCAAPERPSVGNGAVEAHFNYAITDLKPEKRIAPESTTVQFTVELKNFGSDNRENIFLEVYRDGTQDFDASRYYKGPQPGGAVRHHFDMLFDGPQEGQRAKYHRVTVRLMANQGQPLDRESGVLADNVRHAVIEIRKSVPTLVIDGDPEGDRPGGDRRTIETALKSLKGTEAVEVVHGTVDDLANPKIDLEREYATIYLLNVGNLQGKKDKDGKGAERPLERLRAFIKNGGNVVYFMGDKVEAMYYTKTLFEANEGLFPIPLDRAASEELNEKAIEKLRANPAPKIYVLDAEHDITRGIAPYQFTIPDLLIPRYAKAKMRFEWEPTKWSRPGALKELITLAGAQQLNDLISKQAGDLIKRLPISDPNYKKYKGLLEKHAKLITDAKNGQAHELYRLAEAFDKLLADRGDKPGEKDNVSLLDFWKLPEMKDLKTDILAFKRDTLYGDPLVVTRHYGKGNVVAFLTTAGTKWSGWPGDNPRGGIRLGGVASFTFPVVIRDLQRFLTKGSGGSTRLVGENLRIELDPTRYSPESRRFLQIDEGEKDPGRPVVDGAEAGFQAEPKRPAKQEEGKYVVSYDARKPGVQIVKLFPEGKGALPEERWFAFNVDTTNESDLRRVGFDEVVRNPTEETKGRGKIIGPFKPAEKQDLLRERQRDLSESPWLYLLFLLVLIVEQALAVHLSFHVKGSEGAQPAATKASPAAEPAAAA